MKILWLSDGHNFYEKRFLDALVTRGHEPIFVSYGLRDVYPIESVKTIHKPFRFLTRFGSLNPKIGLAKLRLKFILKHLQKVINDEKPDILHSGYVTESGYYGALSGFKPTLLMPWGSDILLNPYKSEYYNNIVKYTINRADRIICNCNIIKKGITNLTGYPKGKITVFPFGVDLAIFKPLKDNSVIRKRLGWQKNVVLIMNRPLVVNSVYAIEYFIKYSFLLVYGGVV